MTSISYSKDNTKPHERLSSLFLLALFTYLGSICISISLSLTKETYDELRTDTNHISPISSQKYWKETEPQSKINLLHPDELKLPVPIIVMGMMKAGTTSIYSYFKCGLDPKVSKITHYDCDDGEKVMTCGKRMRRNIKFKKPAFDSMSNFTVYTELDGQEKHGGLTLPQWYFISNIYEDFPNATWILNTRDPVKWLSSIDRWKDLRQRFIDNHYYPALPRNKGKNDTDMIYFYKEQARRVRDFAQKHPSLSFVELAIDSPNAGDVLEEAFGISKSCWGNHNVNDGKAEWTET